jgi:signal transduction histidine kinase/CheY-like chemotaxis protein
MNERSSDGRKRRGLSLFAAIILFNVLAFAAIGVSYFYYTSAYREKLYQENLNNVENLNIASANAAGNYIFTMGTKVDDTAGYIMSHGLNYEEAVAYLGESNSDPERVFQLIRSAYYEDGVLKSGDYTGVSISRTLLPDGSLDTTQHAVDYTRNYGDLQEAMDDLHDDDFDSVCTAPEFTDADTKLKSFAIYRHVTLEDAHGEQACYTLLVAVNSAQTLRSFNLQNEFEGQSTVLINSSGDYIIKSTDFKGANFYEYLRDYNALTLDQENQIRQNVLSTLQYGERTTSDLFYQSHEGRDCVFCVSAMPNRWYSVTCVPLDSFELENDRIDLSLIILLLFCALFIVDAIAILFAGKAMQRNVSIAENATREAEIANQAKSRFLSTMSHELRTPLNAILGLVSLSGDQIENPTVLSDYFRKIDSSAKLLLQLISDILDVSAIESNKLRLNRSEFDLGKLVSSLSAIYFDQCAAKGIAFNAILIDIHTEMLIGDSVRMNQILLNFLSNAVKFTPSGGRITLKVRQVREEDDTVVLRFDVIDTGCGISDELKTRLFKPFEQEAGDTARRLGGTGLGLSIAKNLTELMGGTISMESTVGEGSRFSAEIPFALPEKRAHSEPQRIDSMYALAAIGDGETGEHIRQMLSHFGIDCTLTDCGTTALELLAQKSGSTQPYTLCILDWKLPDMNAAEISECIRTAYGELPHIVVLAYDIIAAKGPCIASGVNTVLTKPVFSSDLYNALLEIANGSATVAQEDSVRFDFTGRRILLVEDNPLNAEIARMLLARAGFAVETAENGQIGVEMLTASPDGYFSAILMDVQMPVMNGYEATRAIRASAHPQARSIPILAMTADAFSEDVERAAAAGMNEHIAKPIDPDLLFAKLDEHLRREK